MGHSFCRMLGYQPNGAESTGSSPGDPHLDSVTGLGYILKFGRQGLWHLRFTVREEVRYWLEGRVMVV